MWFILDGFVDRFETLLTALQCVDTLARLGDLVFVLLVEVDDGTREECNGQARHSSKDKTVSQVVAAGVNRC